MDGTIKSTIQEKTHLYHNIDSKNIQFHHRVDTIINIDSKNIQFLHSLEGMLILTSAHHPPQSHFIFKIILPSRLVMDDAIKSTNHVSCITDMNIDFENIDYRTTPTPFYQSHRLDIQFHDRAVLIMNIQFLGRFEPASDIDFLPCPYTHQYPHKYKKNKYH